MFSAASDRDAKGVVPPGHVRLGVGALADPGAKRLERHSLASRRRVEAAKRYLLPQQYGNAVRCGEEIPLVADAPGGVTFKALRANFGHLQKWRPIRDGSVSFEASLARREAELRFMEASVNAFVEHQLVVPTLFRDTSLVDDHDPVGVLDRRQAVGDDEGRAAHGQLGK